jgi:hypothetical protein
MNTTAEFETVLVLATAVEPLIGFLDPVVVQSVAANLHARITTQSLSDGFTFNMLTSQWVALERAANTHLDLQKRIQAYIDLLRLPLMVGDARKALLDGLEQLTGEKFEGDLWRFVDWATESNRGQALRLDLSGR